MLSRVGLEWIKFKPNNFHVDFKVKFPYWCRLALEYRDTVLYKLQAKIF